MKKREIFKKQNETDMLNILYSQRHYYNSVNRFEYIYFVVTFIICVFDFFKINSLAIKVVVNGMMVIASFIILKLIEESIIKGAELKKYFDYKLYEFNNLPKDFENKCNGYIYDALARKKKDYSYQINNDGKANPPGLKDWYFDDGADNQIDIIKSMQGQNLYWDQKLSMIYIISLSILFVILLLIYITSCVFAQFSIIQLIIGLTPFINFLIIIVNQAFEYIKIIEKGAYATGLLKNATTLNQLIEIQEIIDDRRKLKFNPPNIIHKIISKKTHQKIEFINRS